MECSGGAGSTARSLKGEGPGEREGRGFWPRPNQLLLLRGLLDFLHGLLDSFLDFLLSSHFPHLLLLIRLASKEESRGST